MASEGVLLRPDQLPSKPAGGMVTVKSDEQKEKDVKKVDRLHLEEATIANGEDATSTAGKWSAANLLTALFKILYIPLGIVTLLLLAINFYLNFPFPLAIALASIVGLQ